MIKSTQTKLIPTGRFFIISGFKIEEFDSVPGVNRYEFLSDEEVRAGCKKGHTNASLVFNKRGMNPNLENYRGW